MNGNEPHGSTACWTRPEAKTWCFFDLDDTLIRRDSFLPFLMGWLVMRRKRFFMVFLLPFAWLLMRLRRKNIAYRKEAFLSAFMKGARREDVDSYVADFWDTFLPQYKNGEMLDRLKWHHENGHSVYLVTSAFDFYADYLETIWPIDGVIATRAEWDADKLTGALNGPNCRGVEKIERIRQEPGIDIQSTHYYAYSGNEADIPLLMNTQHGYLVKSSEIHTWDHEPE